jgi:glycosyltransferase involved in cell wall biosynthesis
MDPGQRIEQIATECPGYAMLRHRVAGIPRLESSDWDLAVANPVALEAENVFGLPDVRIQRRYVIQRFYPWGQLDFLPAFEWNGIEYLASDRFWAGVSRSADGLPRPRLAHDALIAFLSGLLSGGSYNSRYDPLIATAATEDGEEFIACLRWAFGNSWTTELWNWIQSENPGQAIPHVPALRRALWWNSVRRSPGETLWRQAQHWCTELRHHLNPPFPWIAFLGPDGSGKSSVINGVRDRLKARRLHVDVIHWRPQVIRKSGEVPGGVVTDPHAKSPRNLFVSLLKLEMLALEWWSAWPWRIRHGRAKSKLLFSDRYYQDLLVDPRRYRFGAPLGWASAWFRFLPAPQKVIILAGDPATIHDRKQEVTLAEMQRQIAAYRDLAAKLGPRAIVIDACQPLESVIEAAYLEVISQCRSRLGRLRFSPQPAYTPHANSQTPQVAPPARHHRKVLISAYACGPDRGAEANVAWNLVRELSTRNSLTVLTRSTNREVIEGSGEIWTNNIRWIYFDPHPVLSFWRQGSRGTQPFYACWQITARQWAKALLAEETFDLIHHITFGTYLLPSLLSDLGIPLIFGPVGGGESTPPLLSNCYRWSGRIQEILRKFAHISLERLPGIRHWHRSSAWTFATTSATFDALRRIGVTNMSMMTQSAIGGDDVERFAAANPSPGHDEPNILHLVSASRLVHWKAVHLALKAVAHARASGLDVRFTILQDGPELGHLKRLAERLGITSSVTFTGRLNSLAEVFAKILRSDALIHPALHEAFGQACLESLALGVPVICLDWGGPGIIINDSCGFKIQPADCETTIARLAEAIQRLADLKRSGVSLAPAAKARARDFLWSDMAQQIEKTYARIARLQPVDRSAAPYL